MSQKGMIYLPEAVVQDLLGKNLPQFIGQEFDYNGARYRVCQQDPLRMEAEVPCELIRQLPDMDMPREQKRRRKK